MSAVLDAAHDLARRGLPVLPIAPRGKRPLGRLVPHGLQDATTDPEIIARWWTAEPEANVGARTGDGIAVLDVDPRHSGDHALRDMIDRHGPLPDTPTVATGGGGWHHWFRADDGDRRSARLGPGLELKATGAYVLCPPSITEREYAWIIPFSREALAPIPVWLDPDQTAQHRPHDRHDDRDFLRRLPPPRYVANLAGADVPAGGGKIRCVLPGHDDRTASMHVYPNPDQGWFCFGCHRGGDIHTLAALLTGRAVPLRGIAFLAVEDLLTSFYEKRLGVAP